MAEKIKNVDQWNSVDQYLFHEMNNLRSALKTAEDLKELIEWELGYDDPDMYPDTPLGAVCRLVHSLKVELRDVENKIIKGIKCRQN